MCLNLYFKIRFCNNSNCSEFTNAISDVTFKKRLYDCNDKNLQGIFSDTNLNYQSNRIISVQKITNSKINYLFEKNILLQPGFEFQPNNTGFFTTEQSNCE